MARQSLSPVFLSAVYGHMVCVTVCVTVYVTVCVCLCVWGAPMHMDLSELTLTKLQWLTVFLKVENNNFIIPAQSETSSTVWREDKITETPHRIIQSQIKRVKNTQPELNQHIHQQKNHNACG